MGTGKTAVGQLAAKMLGLSFLDSDLEIEKKYHTSISQIFKTDGEIGFRKMEKTSSSLVILNQVALFPAGAGFQLLKV